MISSSPSALVAVSGLYGQTIAQLAHERLATIGMVLASAYSQAYASILCRVVEPP